MDVSVKKGEVYVFCRCGLSPAYPLCDGSHKGTGIRPLRFKAEKTEVIQFKDGQV